MCDEGLVFGMFGWECIFVICEYVFICFLIFCMCRGLFGLVR